MPTKTREQMFVELVQLLLKAIPYSQDGREEEFRKIILLLLDLVEPENRP